MALVDINVEKQRAEHASEVINPIGWLKVTH